MVKYTEIKTGPQILQGVVRADGEHVAYINPELREQTQEDGTYVELVDFHNAARTAEASQATGTRVFKRTFSNLAEPESPFVEMSWLTGVNSRARIFTSFGYTGICLADFMIRTQSLVEHIESTPDKDLVQEYGQKGAVVLRLTLYD